jgi:hypothetical protein
MRWPGKGSSPARRSARRQPDIRPGLAGDGKQGNEHSPVAAEVLHVIHSGGQSSGLMMTKLRANEVLRSEDKLCGRNCQMAKQNGG